MLNNNTMESELFQNAFGPGKDCPPIEQLESLTAATEPAADLAEHVRACAYCQTELHLLKTFQAEGLGEMSPEARRTAALLQKRPRKILRSTDLAEARLPWWKAAFTIRGLAQASVALAVVLLVAAAVIVLRTSKNPSLNDLNRIGEDTLRSGNFNIVSPVGDLQERPQEIRWEKVKNATTYQVRLLEVDRSEMWSVKTTEEHVDVPASLRARIVPAKTLFWEINAYDSAGNKVGETGPVRFRLLSNRDGH